MFDNKNAEDAEIVFKYAVEIANTEILGTSNNRLEAAPQKVPEGNEFAVSKRVCRLLRVSFGFPQCRRLVINLNN